FNTAPRSCNLPSFPTPLSSDLQWDEKYYSPFSITTKAYFYKDISKAMLELPIKDKPNQKFKYQSGDTQLLGMVLEKALPVSLSEDRKSTRLNSSHVKISYAVLS